MMVRKFYADSAREALRLVREKLGPNALILSNRKTGAGIEIMAVPEAEIDAVTVSKRPAPVASRRDTAMPRASDGLSSAAASGKTISTATVRAAVHPQPQARSDAGQYDLVQEVRILRSMLEGQLAAFAWSD